MVRPSQHGLKAKASTKTAGSTTGPRRPSLEDEAEAFDVCLFVSLFVCLFVSLFVCVREVREVREVFVCVCVKCKCVKCLCVCVCVCA